MRRKRFQLRRCMLDATCVSDDHLRNVIFALLFVETVCGGI